MTATINRKGKGAFSSLQYPPLWEGAAFLAQNAVKQSWGTALLEGFQLLFTGTLSKHQCCTKPTRDVVQAVIRLGHQIT